MIRLKQVVATLVALGLTVASVEAASAVSGFDDVSRTDYYGDAVEWLGFQQITTGTSATTFSPDATVTRGQMAAFLARLAGRQYPVQCTDAPTLFIDVDRCSYAFHPVLWLADHRITTGTSPTTFSPDEPVTRGQLATFLWRYAGAPMTTTAVDFDDVVAGSYYEDAVRWLVDQGITTGTSPTTFSPDEPATRAQMATFLWRFAGRPVYSDQGANRTPARGVDPDEDPLGTGLITIDGIRVQAAGHTETAFVRARRVDPPPAEITADGVAVEVTVAGPSLPSELHIRVVVDAPCHQTARRAWQLVETGWVPSDAGPVGCFTDPRGPAVSTAVNLDLAAPATPFSAVGPTYQRFVVAVGGEPLGPRPFVPPPSPPPLVIQPEPLPLP